MAAAADTHLPQRGLGPGKIACGVEAFVNGDRLIEELAGAGHIALSHEGGASILGGEGKPSGRDPRV